MKITQSRQGSVQIVTLTDTVTDEEGQELRAVVESAISANAGRVVLNLQRTPYVDSAGLEALADCADSCRQVGRRLKLAAVTDTLREILEITELDDRFDFYPDIDRAVRSYLHGSIREVTADDAEESRPGRTTTSSTEVATAAAK